MSDDSILLQYIIQAQNQAAAVLAQNSTQLTNIATALGNVNNAAAQASKGTQTFQQGMQTSVATGAFFGSMLADIVQNGFNSLKSALADSVTVANTFNNTFIGLATVSRALKQDVDAVKQAAVDLSSDGLMSVNEAAMGLKNLMMSGFGLPQAIDLMKGFKNIASFNRQASLDFGYAVVSATEGIKNQNSILVDNAGLTKNLSVILREMGLAQGDLSKIQTDANVRAKFFTGLMKEMAPMTGDAARLSDTYSGSLARMRTQFTYLQVEVGNVLMPIFSMFNNLMGGAFTIMKSAPGVILSVATAFGALATALVLVKSMQQITSMFGSATDAAKLLTTGIAGPAGLTIAVTALGVALGLSIIKLQEWAETSESSAAKGIRPFSHILGAVQGLAETWITASISGITYTQQLEAMNKASMLSGKLVIGYAEAMQIINEHTAKAADLTVKAKFAFERMLPKGLTNDMAGMVSQFDKTNIVMQAGVDHTNNLREAHRILGEDGIKRITLLMKDNIDVSDELEKAFDGNKKMAKALTAQITEQIAKDKEAGAEQKKRIEGWKDLGKVITDAKHDGMSNATIIERLGNELHKAGVDAFFFKEQLPKIVQEFVALERTKFITDMLKTNLAKIKDDVKGIIEQNWEDSQKRMNFQLEREVKNVELVNATYEKSRDVHAVTEKEKFELTRTRLEETMNEQLKALQMSDMWSLEAAVAIAEMYQYESDAAKKSFEEQEAEAREAADNIGNYFKGLLNDIPNILKSALTGGGGVGGALKAMLSDVGSHFGTTMFQAGGMLNGLNEKIFKGLGAGKVGEMVSNLLPGIGGAIGAFIGPLVEKLAGIIHKPEWKKLKSDIGRDLGVGISDQLAQSMEGNSKKFGRAVATALDLNKIIAEAGGIAKFGVEKATKSMRDMFVYLSEGKATVEQVGEVFEENLGELIPASIDKTTGLISESTFELLKMGRQANITSKQMTEFFTQMAEKAGSGFNAISIGFGKPLVEGAKKVKEALGELDVTLVGKSQVSLDRYGRFAVATFQNAIASGKSFLEAVELIGPGLDSLNEAQKELGLSSSGTFAELLKFRGFVHDNQELAASITGLHDLMVGLGNSGAVTQQLFTDFGTEAQSQFDKMAAAGLTHDQIMMAMQPTLQTLFEMQERYGYAVDETTQKMLDDAKAAGIVGDKHKSASERMVDGIDKVINRLELMLKHFGVDLPAAIDGLPDSINIPVHFPTDNLPTPDGGNPSFDEAHMAAGGVGRVTRPTWFLAGEAGSEDFAFSGGNKSFSNMMQPQGDATADPKLLAGIDGMRRELRNLTGSITIAVRDGVLLAG